MLSMSEDWYYIIVWLFYINRESIDTIHTFVWELEKAGYIKRRMGRGAKNKKGNDWVHLLWEATAIDIGTDNSMMENSMQLNKDI